MEARLRWVCNLADVMDHQPDSVLWYRQGYTRGPLIYPASYTPAGPCLRLGTMEALAQLMQQALERDASLRQSLRCRDTLAVPALCSEQGTSYRFQPTRASDLFLGS